MTEGLFQKVSNTINKIIHILEKDRTNLITAPLLILAYILVRMYFEGTFFHSGPFWFNDEYFTGKVQLILYNAYHQIFGLFTVFTGGALIMTYFSKEKARKVVNAMLCGFWLIIPAPLIDHYVFHRVSGYQYIELGEPLLLGAGFGLLIQLTIILLLAFLYVFIKCVKIYQIEKMRTRVGIGFLRGIVAALFLLLLMVSAAIAIPFLGELLKMFFDQYAAQVVSSLVFFCLSVFFVSFLIDISNKKILPTLVRNLKTYQLLYLSIVAVVGIVLAGRFLFKNSHVYTEEIPYTVLVLFTITFGWQFALMMEDISKTKDKNKKIHKVFTIIQYKQCAILLAIISFGFSIQLGVVSMLLTLTFIAIAWVYFSKLLTLKNKIITPIVFGLESLLAFLIGYCTMNDLTYFILGNWVLIVPTLTTFTMSQIAVSVGIGIFIIGIIISIIGRWKEW